MIKQIIHLNVALMKDPPSNVPHKCVKIINHKGIEKYVEHCKWSAWDSRSQKILNAGLSKSIEIAVLYHARLKGWVTEVACICKLFLYLLMLKTMVSWNSRPPSYGIGIYHEESYLKGLVKYPLKDCPFNMELITPEVYFTCFSKSVQRN